jgi:hypothetical protein
VIYRATLKDAAKVESWIERDFHAVDYSEVLANEMNVCLCQGEGGAIFVWRGPGIYEAHCFFEQRGREVREISNAILALMAADYGAKLIWTAIPDDRRNVKTYARWLGFKPVDHAVFPYGPCEIFTWETARCHQNF